VGEAKAAGAAEAGAAPHVMSRRKGSRARLKAARRRERSSVAKSKGRRDKRTGKPLARTGQ